MSKTFYEIHFTGEGFRTLTVYRLFYARAMRDIKARRAAYEAEVRDWYENGDGRAQDWARAGGQPWFDAEHDDPDREVNVGGKGHTFPHCIHGANLWVDHDIPCGACEMGESDIELAIQSARESFLRFIARWEWVMAAPGDLSSDTRRELEQWAISLFPLKENRERLDARACVAHGEHRSTTRHTRDECPVQQVGNHCGHDACHQRKDCVYA